jgi:hypothetical protein
LQQEPRADLRRGASLRRSEDAARERNSIKHLYTHVLVHLGSRWSHVTSLIIAPEHLGFGKTV